MPPDGLRAHFGPLEYAVLEVVWSAPGLDVQDCVDALGPRHAYSTVKTVLERLTTKGVLTREKHARSYRYRPARPRQELEEDYAERSARALLDGYGRLGIAGFVDAVRRDPDDVARLQRLLEAVPSAPAAAEQDKQ